MREDIPASNDSVSTLVDAKLANAQYVGPTCEKCHAPLSGNESLACRECGWYASIGSYVEIDKSWEVATDPDAASAIGPAADKTAVPQWAWVLMGCITTVIVGSVFVRLATLDAAAMRTSWSVTQLFSGFGIFAACHAIGFALLLRASSEANLMDIILHPINIWANIFRELPKRQWLCHAGLGGLTAAAMSIIVIGGLPYEKLLDWGTKAPPKRSLMAAVMEQAQNLEGGDDKSLEEAIEDFAGSQNLDEDEKKKKPKPKPKPRIEEDCVVLGYQTTSDGLVYSLIIGGENYGRLIYTGKVSLNIPVEENRELRKQLATLKIRKPFVKVPIDRDQAIWVTPQYVCRISFKRKGKQGGMFDAELEELRGIMEMRK